MKEHVIRELAQDCTLFALHWQHRGILAVDGTLLSQHSQSPTWEHGPDIQPGAACGQQSAAWAHGTAAPASLAKGYLLQHRPGKTRNINPEASRQPHSSMKAAGLLYALVIGWGPPLPSAFANTSWIEVWLGQEGHHSWGGLKELWEPVGRVGVCHSWWNPAKHPDCFSLEKANLLSGWCYQLSWQRSPIYNRLVFMRLGHLPAPESRSWEMWTQSNIADLKITKPVILPKKKHLNNTII